MRFALVVVLCLLAPLSQADEAEPIEVQVATLGELAKHSQLSRPARVESLNRSTLAAQLSAEVVALSTLPGQRVEQGQLLLELDASDYQLALDSAEAQLRSAQAETQLAQVRLERARNLSGEEFVSVDQLAEAQTRYQVALAQQQVVEQQQRRAQLDLSRTQIKAPFAGLVLQRLVNLGEQVSPGTPLLLLLDEQSIEVVAELPVSDVGSLRVASELQLRTAQGDYPLRLERVTEAVESGARTQQARLVFTDRHALVGIEGHLLWRDHRPRVSAQLLQRRNGHLGVFVVEQQRVRFHAVEGAQEGRAALLDLSAETLLVSEGQQRLQDGDRVRF